MSITPMAKQAMQIAWQLYESGFIESAAEDPCSFFDEMPKGLFSAGLGSL